MYKLGTHQKFLMTLFLTVLFLYPCRLQSQNAQSSFMSDSVEVKFIVTVPVETRSREDIYLMGTFNNWDPGPGSPPDSTDIKLVFTTDYKWEVTLKFPDRQRIEYKYTRGSEETVENNPDSTERPNRVAFVSSEESPMILNDVVLSWRDFTQPQQPENSPPILSFFNNESQTSIAITWITESYADSKIYYGESEQLENIVDVNEHVDLVLKDDRLVHRGKLENLKPSTKYYYKVVTGEVYESKIQSFTTCDFENAFLFCVTGDNRPTIDTNVMNGLILDKPRFIFHTGDLAADGRLLDDWFLFTSLWYPSFGTTAWMPMYGNHERDKYLNKFFNLPANNSIDTSNWGHWYSFEYNNIHFIVLDNYRDYSPGSDQHNWLLNDLSNIPGSIDYRIVLFHEPPFSSGRHGPNLTVREHIIPLIEEYNIDVVFCGHEHLYERSIVNGIQYVTTGGAGSSLYFLNPGQNEYSVIAETIFHYMRIYVKNKNIKVEMVKGDGSIGDTFEIIKDFSPQETNKFILKQNYPNPFNAKTIIKYVLPEPQFVTLKIFDVLGREVTTAINSFVQAGTHFFQLNGSGFVSGIYFYTLNAGTYSDTKKFILLK